jgi:asparagine synthase (glutamine-hydrolysing)
MCGLTGAWEPPGELEGQGRRLRAMAACLAHRGPDDEGHWSDPSSGIGFGFRRLAVVDVSPAGHQPMFSRDERFVVAFNGEIYNHRELRRELESHGARFRGTSDTEVIVEALARWGVADMLPRFWGMFAIAAWDRATRTLWLARDRLGKKPLYYTNAGGTWLFGSELKALRRHPACPTAIDRSALAAYFRYGYVPAPFSILAGVCKLPPGSVLEIGG